MAGLTNRIVRNDVNHQIFFAVIYQLVSLTRLENEYIASYDFRQPGGVSNFSGSLDHVVKLPLGTVGMIWTHGFARRNATNRNVKGMSVG